MGGIEYAIVTVFIAIWIVGGFIAFKFLRKGLARDREKADSLAAGLGLELVQGEEALRRMYRDSGQESQLAAFEKMPEFIRRFSIAMTPWRIEGERGGIRVAVYRESRGKNNSTYTIARAYPAPPLPFSLSVTREGGAYKLGKALFGLQDIELGDPELDPIVKVKSGDPMAARLRLGQGEARSALLEAATLKYFRLTESYAHWERHGAADDPAELGPILDLLVRVAKAVSG